MYTKNQGTYLFVISKTIGMLVINFKPKRPKIYDRLCIRGFIFGNWRCFFNKSMSFE